MYVAQIYGLWVVSDFWILDTPEIGLEARHPDVVVRLGIADNNRLQASSQVFSGFLPKVGKFLICNGNEVIVEPLPDVDERTLRPCILGSAMSVILQQRGFLVLHASAVVMQSEAIAFLGTSGAGKSTTASAFMKQGYSVITDDVLAVQFQDGVPMVIPSYPFVKLLPDAVAALGHDAETLPLLNRTTAKRIQSFENSHLLAAYPLRKIYVLTISDRHEVSDCPATEALLNLVDRSRALNALTDPGSKKRHFQQCTDMVKSRPISILHRKPGLDELSEIVRQIETDLAR
ncbi:hypothetical protein [Altericista sp. CCNU0014]|uniref:hypothetical protein n=1 Tax=Altericista sp. CCNU0014 TaxID=3082949 RepID=UPI003850A057